jgi:hypothetical protein
LQQAFRSMTRPRICGPRSLMRTTTDRPVWNSRRGGGRNPR